MKNLKIVGLILVMGLMLSVLLGAGTASATKLYKLTTPAANDPLGVGTVIKGEMEAGASAIFEDAFGLTAGTCTSMAGEGKIEKDEGTPRGKMSVFTFGGCAHTVDSKVLGELEIRHIAGTTNGTMFSRGTTATVFNTLLNQTCTANTGEGTDLGTLTGATSSTGQATMDINGVIPLEGCSASSARLTGKGVITQPTGLIVEAS